MKLKKHKRTSSLHSCFMLCPQKQLTNEDSAPLGSIDTIRKANVLGLRIEVLNK